MNAVVSPAYDCLRAATVSSRRTAEFAPIKVISPHMIALSAISIARHEVDFPNVDVGANRVVHVGVIGGPVPRFATPSAALWNAVFTPAAITSIPLNRVAAAFGPLMEAATRNRAVELPHIPRAAASLDDFFPVDNQPLVEPLPDIPATPLPQPALDHDSLIDELAEALSRFQGLKLLKQVFWRVLGYEPVDEPIARKVFRSSLRDFVARAVMFAEHDGVRVVLVTLAAGVARANRAAIVRQVGDRFPGALVLLANSAFSRVTLGWAGHGAEPEVRLIGFHPSHAMPDATARRFAVLRVFDRYDRERTTTELFESFDGLFRHVEPIDLSDPDERVLSVEELLFRELGRHPLISREETRDLLARVAAIPICDREGERKSEYEGIRNRLVMANLRFVRYAIRRDGILRRLRSLTEYDLMQAAIIGLCRAVDRFDQSRNAQFSTYAYHWVRNAIQRAFHSTDGMIRLPAYVHDDLRLVWPITERLFHQHRREPSPEEIADAIDCIAHPSASVADAVRAITRAPLTGRTDTACPCAGLRDPHPADPVDAVLFGELSDTVENVLRRLNERERDVLTLRFGIGHDREHTLEEIANNYDLTRERIRQIESRALTRLGGPKYAHFFSESPKETET